MQRSNVEFELGLLTEALIAVRAYVATLLVDFPDVATNVSGTFKLFITLYERREKKIHLK